MKWRHLIFAFLMGVFAMSMAFVGCGDTSAPLYHEHPHEHECDCEPCEPCEECPDDDDDDGDDD